MNKTKTFYHGKLQKEVKNPVSGRTFKLFCILLIFFIFSSSSAYAYIGPGIGLSMLSALWAVIVAVLLAVGGILYWPIRSLIRRSRKGKTDKESSENRQ